MTYEWLYWTHGCSLPVRHWVCYIMAMAADAVMILVSFFSAVDAE